MKTLTAFILSLIAIVTLAAGSAFGAYSGGTGEPSSPYKIATKADLLALADNTDDYGKCFILTADINMQGQVFTTAIIASDTSFFTGTFDGSGHKITNFTIDDGSNSLLGLFGFIDLGGLIKNLGIENFAVSGSEYIGGLVGWNSGNISNCYLMGTVSGISFVGGLVGLSYNGNISQCYSMSAVSGNGYGWSIGGLVGRNYDAGINNCYSAGKVSSSSGSLDVGGLVGSDYSGSVVGSFWDVNTSCQTGSSGGVGLNTLQMKQKASFTGWDFTNETANGINDYWRMCVNGVDYPRLNWESTTGDFACPDGVDLYDLTIFMDQWLLEKLTWDTSPNGGDRIVNFIDWATFADKWQGDMNELADFASQWLKPGAYCADIAPAPSGDGIVNFVDFAVFAENWLQQ
jgi:hypothetical protein